MISLDFFPSRVETFFVMLGKMFFERAQQSGDKPKFTKDDLVTTDLEETYRQGNSEVSIPARCN